jgi:hypothetical protein
MVIAGGVTSRRGYLLLRFSTARTAVAPYLFGGWPSSASCSGRIVIFSAIISISYIETDRRFAGRPLVRALALPQAELPNEHDLGKP